MTRHLDDGTLRTIIERCKEAALQSVTPVILLTTGSFNPIHRQHVNMHIIAKAHLEQRYKVRIVMSVLSPSSDLYVKPKLRASGRIDRHLTHAQRCQLIELATQDHPDIVLDNVRRQVSSVESKTSCSLTCSGKACSPNSSTPRMYSTTCNHLSTLVVMTQAFHLPPSSPSLARTLFTATWIAIILLKVSELLL
eukprot:TRINITY_DN6779_c0_g1_i2.p1 TRINITY_DN6779_c0_g1~~TRINITY_DN6779_c0_g1_i2.p1  ORF type:complete len:194 (+),score=33.36 TRINITY_DN6779_c0_g1_i2:154-735(+)